MKRFSLMAAISALLGSSVSEASPAFKKYKDALAAYKKDSTNPAKVDAVLTAYDALGGPHSLRGDILARDQYMTIVVGKDKAADLKATRKLRKDAKRGGAAGSDKLLKDQIKKLEDDLAALKVTETGLKAEKTTLQAEVARLGADVAAKATTIAEAITREAELKEKILLLTLKTEPAALNALKNDLINKLKLATAKPTIDEQIEGVASLIEDKGAAKDLLEVILANLDGMPKLKIDAIAENASNASLVDPLNKLAQVLEVKSTVAGVDTTALVKVIKDKAEAIKAAISVVDWSTAGKELILGKKGIKANTRDAIDLVKDQTELVDYFTTILAEIVRSIGIADESKFVPEQSYIDSLSEGKKADWISFYTDFLPFIERGLAHADSKRIDTTSSGYQMLVFLRDGIKAALPKLAEKKADVGGGAATDPVIAKFDKSVIAAANDQPALSALVAKTSKEFENVDLFSSNKDARVAAARDFVKELLNKSMQAKVDVVDLGYLKDSFEGSIGEDL